MANRLGIDVNLPVGATKDLFLMDIPDLYPEGLVHFVIADTPRSVTGIQKVAQLFLKVLLTTQGSDLVHTSLGTNFPLVAVNANRTGVDSELYSLIITEIRKAEAQVIQLTYHNDSASKLQTIEILGVQAVSDSISLYLQMTTEAGESAAVAVPMPQTDMKIRTY